MSSHSKNIEAKFLKPLSFMREKYLLGDLDLKLFGIEPPTQGFSIPFFEKISLKSTD